MLSIERIKGENNNTNAERRRQIRMLREHQSPIAYEKIMKCPKTLCATAVAAMMIATMGSSVWAADANTAITGTATSSGKTTLSYSVQAGYQWTVPTTITFTAGSEESETTQTGKVNVTKNVIAENQSLKITATGNGGGTDESASGSGFIIKNTAGTSLNYTVKTTVDNTTKDVSDGGEVLKVNSGVNTKEAELTFTLTKHSGQNSAEVPGDYTGLVTYTASVD